MIFTCNCENPAQDVLHGDNRRIYNATSKDNTYRCSVCVREIKTDTPKKKGKK